MKNISKLDTSELIKEFDAFCLSFFILNATTHSSDSTHFVFEYANKSFCEKLNISQNEIIGKEYFEINQITDFSVRLIFLEMLFTTYHPSSKLIYPVFVGKRKIFSITKFTKMDETHLNGLVFDEFNDLELPSDYAHKLSENILSS